MCEQNNALFCEVYDVDGYMFRREMLLPSSDHLYILESIYFSKFLAPIYQTARCSYFKPKVHNTNLHLRLNLTP
jgi:hypothetical protein